MLQTFLSKERYYTSTPMREAPSLSSGGAFSILYDSEILIESIWDSNVVVPHFKNSENKKRWIFDLDCCRSLYARWSRSDAITVCWRSDTLLMCGPSGAPTRARATLKNFCIHGARGSCRKSLSQRQTRSFFLFESVFERSSEERRQGHSELRG